MSRIAIINALLLALKYIFKSSDGIPLKDGMILEWVIAVNECIRTILTIILAITLRD
jgi:hypothetical protein